MAIPESLFIMEYRTVSKSFAVVRYIQLSATTMLRVSRASISPPPRRQGHSVRRDGLTNAQKQELRKWWADDSHGKRKHSDAKAWVKAKWNKDIKKSTLSDALSSKLAWLDDTNLNKHQATVIKNRKLKWPTLEAVLLE